MALRILPGPCLAQRTTLELGGTALAEVRAEIEQDLEQLPDALARLGGTAFVLGRGSNILARDGELDLVVVSVGFDQEPTLVDDGRETVRVRAGAGVRLPSLLAWLAGRGLSGLEGLAGIPGTLGGAVAMNAGSYGMDLAGVVARVLAFSPERGLDWFEREECESGYRRFALKDVSGMFVVAGVELDLKRAEPARVRADLRENYLRKKGVQPVLAHSAGCVFKNLPDGRSAGRLLDEAGLKGVRLGGMVFSEMHANFLVNEGGGTAEQALALIDLAQERVRERFGEELELEVKVCPCC